MFKNNLIRGKESNYDKNNQIDKRIQLWRVWNPFMRNIYNFYL